MKKFSKIIFFFIIITHSFPVFSSGDPDRIIGVYYVIEPTSKEESKVRIYKTANGQYEGSVIWLKVPNFPDGSRKKDIKNPDPALRNTAADKIILLRNFVYNAKKNEWSGGEIYNPVEGKFYKSFMTFESEKKLKVRGYIGIPALGRSMYWEKIE